MGGGLPVTVEPAQLRGSCRRCSSGVRKQPPRPILSVLRASASAGWVGGCCGSAALTSSTSLSRPTQWEPERCDGCRPQPADDESRKDPAKYNNWYKQFGNNIKAGIQSDPDNKELIFKLLRFMGTFTEKKDAMISID